MFSSAIGRFNEKRRVSGENGEDAGFTLIELMVVLLILAILLAIAIPTFLGVTKSANDRAAQSNINTAFTNAKALYQQYGQSYTNSSVGGWNTASFEASLVAAEPSLKFVAGSTTAATGNSTATGVVSVWVDSAGTNGQGLVLAAYSPNSKNCWLFVDEPGTPANAPFGAAGTAAITTPVATATTVTFSNSTPGDQYAEIKNDPTVGDCDAGDPVIGVGATYGLSTSGYPS